MIYITLDRNSKISLSRQIYIFIRDNILNGTLPEKEKLPSTRELSKYLNVSRNVVIESYDQLFAEGYISTRNGSGTYVNDGILFSKEYALNNNDKMIEKNIPSCPENAEDKNTADKKMISFRTGIPDLSSVPIKKWAQIYKEVSLSASPAQMDYQNSSGEYELRYQLAHYLYIMRGVDTKPENIIITNGAAQAFSLLCRLVPKNQCALVENPLSYGILHTLKSNNVEMYPVPVDEYGMMTCRLPKTVSPRLIFTTPSHQFPTGVILPVKRRIEMIQYARMNNSYIIEDDYDSEFRFMGNPIQSMQSLDPSRVIYVGTFSKTFMPSLRMGYMILPDELCTLMKSAKYIDDLHSPSLEQLTMAKFIEEGFFALHIKKMKSIYFKRRNFLIKCLSETFKDTVTISGAEAGMHLIVSFKNIIFDKNLMDKIKNNNIEITPVNKHYINDTNSSETKSPYDNCLIFGYGNTDFHSIETGVKLLYEIIM